MLTRVEIDGFKTFGDFALDVGPFTVVLGANASGKSNLFDALRLLSNLASRDLRRAFRDLRGEAPELFRRQPEPAERMRFAVEVLLDPEGQDPWGRELELSHTRIRYELEIERQQDERGLERLVVAREEARPIFVKDDGWVAGREVSPKFRERYLQHSRRSPWLITDSSEPGEPRFEIRQDGRQGRPFPARAAEATVLSTVTTGEFPHLYALREEIRSWRFLQLDPAALRRPSPAVGVAEELEPDGSNLAYVLARIQAETAGEERPRGRLAEIAAELAGVIPGVVDVEVQGDRASAAGALSVREGGVDREYRIDIAMRDAVPFSSRVVSDGTLRVLALLTLLHDPLHRGLLLFEEPENGIHPARLKSLIERLRGLVTDPASPEVVETEPLSQVIMNSHSPVVLSALLEEMEGVRPDVVFADVVTRVDPDKGVSYPTTRMRSVAPRDQGKLFGKGEGGEGSLDRFEVNRYLATVDTSGV